MTKILLSLGQNLSLARKKKYPHDTLLAFATRCEIGLSTYKKMEKGVLSVGLHQYYKAAQVLGLEATFNNLLQMEENWFE